MKIDEVQELIDGIRREGGMYYLGWMGGLIKAAIERKNKNISIEKLIYALEQAKQYQDNS